MLDNTSNQPSKFSTKNWVGKNDDARGTWNINSQINFKTMKSFSTDKLQRLI